MPTVPFRLWTPKRRLHTPGHLVWRKRSHIDVKYVANGIRTWTAWNITNRIPHHAIPNFSSLRAALWTLVEASCRDKTSTLLGLGSLALVKNSYKVLFFFLKIVIPHANQLRLFLTASSLCIWFNERFGDGVQCGLYVMFHLDVVWLRISLFEGPIIIFLFWVTKISRFSFALVSKICLSGSENRFMFSSKRVVLSFFVFFFLNHAYLLAVPFFGINFSMSWGTMTLLDSKRPVVEGETLLFFAGGSCPFSFFLSSFRAWSVNSRQLGQDVNSVDRQMMCAWLWFLFFSVRYPPFSSVLHHGVGVILFSVCWCFSLFSFADRTRSCFSFGFPCIKGRFCLCCFFYCLLVLKRVSVHMEKKFKDSDIITPVHFKLV